MKNVYAMLLILLASMCGLPLSAQQQTILNYIVNKSAIQEGGSDLFKYEGQTYLITVASLDVGSKSAAVCKKIGSAKAKRDMYAYVNGADITSYTELKVSQTTSSSLESENVQIEQSYVETIKETVMGTINGCNPLGQWYSPDKSVFYYAIYKKMDI